jgi:hypothetical protein
MQAREALECCKLSLIGDSHGSSKDQSGDRNVDSNTILIRFQMGTRTLLELG